MFSPLAAKVVAVCVLTVAALAPLAWVAVQIRRSPFTPLQTVLYGINQLVTRTLWRARLSGPLPLAPQQGAVIVCNHRSSLDPSFIAITGMRAVHWMVAKEYCVNPVFAWILRLCEVIPTSRGGVDTAATRTAIRHAQQGGLVGIFPEGRINVTPRLLLPGRSGAAMIALKGRVPVIPCYVQGSPYNGTALGCLLMPARVRVKIGPPIDLSPYYGRENEREVLEELTKQFLCAIAKLADQPDFQPELAGRCNRHGNSRTSLTGETAGTKKWCR
jgi:1-acyl-sn-glycerol-3-phosphate acyltransferase